MGLVNSAFQFTRGRSHPWTFTPVVASGTGINPTLSTQVTGGQCCGQKGATPHGKAAGGGGPEHGLADSNWRLS